MTPLTTDNGLGLIVTGFLFGLGFAIAQWLWATLIGLVRSKTP